MLTLAMTIDSSVQSGFALMGIPVEFILFGMTLLCIALFHHKTMQIAVAGLLVITAYEVVFRDLHLVEHYRHEAPLLVNLLGLLVGFAILSEHFAKSRVPDLLPNILPNGWRGGFVLLVLVFVLSTFLDNIAAAMIGGTIASVVFKKRVHLGYLAAIVAASNAGGAGSVIGDTTTTMMWIANVPWTAVLPAFIASGTALLAFGIVAARQQDGYQRITADAPKGIRVDRASLLVVVLILACAILAAWKFDLPALGVWTAILLTAGVRRPAWHEVPTALKGSVFLLSLVGCASMMPVGALPEPSWRSTLGLGFVSAVFDNIPLTKLALDQGGYDWGFLAYAVGFGGSMVWFGSSAGVAISNIFPEAKSAGAWLKNGYHVVLAYLIGYLALLGAMGWRPDLVPR